MFTLELQGSYRHLVVAGMTGVQVCMQELVKSVFLMDNFLLLYHRLGIG